MESASFMTIVPALVAPDGFFDKAAATLRQIVAAHPHKSQAWQRLGEVCRATGNLEGAREAYQRWLDLQPAQHEAAYVLSIVAGKDLPAAVPAPEYLPCPFARVERFLPQDEHDHLLELAHAHHDTLVPAKVGEGTYDPQVRSSRLVPELQLQEVRSWFVPRVTALLPAIVSRVLDTALTVERIELQMTIHHQGDFYLVHRDDGKGETQTRRLSYVYYFHRQPRCFSGGDLLLYDTHVTDSEYRLVFTRLEPLDNTIVFFPSQFFHQVTPVQCATDNYRDGRFTVNGWLHAQGDAQAVVSDQSHRLTSGDVLCT